jgi:CRP-like cAMP-binding protein
MSGTDRAHELGAFLAGIPFFASFDTDTLIWLARQFEPVHAQAGDAIIAEGDPGDGLYVLLSGRGARSRTCRCGSSACRRT